jgi:tetratricopeptide (TPR) repeat protein
MEQQGPLTLEDVLAQSDLLVERRRFDQARTLLGHALKARPEHEDILYRLALVDYLEGHDEPALKAVLRLLAKAPAHYGGRFLHAELLERRKQLAAAESVWLDLIRDFPESADLYAQYAQLMLSTLNLEKARRLAMEGLRFEPENEAALYVMAISDLIAGKQGQHSRHLEALVREHPENVATTIALILALQDRCDWSGALRLAQELLKSQPTDEELVEIVRDLKVENHWSMWPLFPMRRWRWAGSIGVWVVAVIGLNVAGRMSSSVVGPVLVLWLVYVVYSWIWPAQLKRFV